MAASITDILATLQNGVLALNNIKIALNGFFPVTTVSTSVTAGTITYTSSQASGFLTVITSSGATFKIPLYGV